MKKIFLLLAILVCVIGAGAFAQIQMDSVDRDPANVPFLDNQLLLPDGRHGKPSFSFSLSPNSGMWWYPFDGTVRLGAFSTVMAISAEGLIMRGDTYLGWGDTTFHNHSNPDTFLWRQAADIIAQRDGTQAQEFRVYNTDDGAGNTEYASLGWQESANAFAISSNGSSGTGTKRALLLNGQSSMGFKIGSAEQWRLVSSTFFPVNDNAETLGQDSFRPSTVYTYDLDAKGKILVADGTQAAPAYSFAGDSVRNRTGMRYSGAGVVFSSDGNGVAHIFNDGIRLTDQGCYTWSTSLQIDGAYDVSLCRGGAGILSLRDELVPTNAQEFRVYNTDDGAGNTEYGTFGWLESANILAIGTRATGTGTQYNVRLDSGSGIQFRLGGTNQWQIKATEFYPEADNQDSFGTDSLRPSTVYTYDLDAKGKILAADGTFTAPTYSFASDTDTGFYRDSANSIVGVFGGTRAIRLVSGGINLGTGFLSYAASVTSTADVSLTRSGAGILSQINGTNPQEFRVYNTDDGAGNTEYGFLSWQGITNEFYVGTASAGTGANRRLTFNGGGSIFFRVNGNLEWSIGGSSFTPNADNVNDIAVSSQRVKRIYTYDLDAKGKIELTPQTETIADTGDATPATLTLDPTASNVQITCNDPNTCDITMSETSAVDGDIVTILNMSANTVDMADTAGVSELAGAFAMGQYDSISLIYASDRWVETGRSNN